MAVDHRQEAATAQDKQAAPLVVAHPRPNHLDQLGANLKNKKRRHQHQTVQLAGSAAVKQRSRSLFKRNHLLNRKDQVERAGAYLEVQMKRAAQAKKQLVSRLINLVHLILKLKR